LVTLQSSGAVPSPFLPNTRKPHVPGAPARSRCRILHPFLVCCGSGWQVEWDEISLRDGFFKLGAQCVDIAEAQFSVRRRGRLRSTVYRENALVRHGRASILRSSLGSARDFACGLRRPQNGSTSTRPNPPSLRSGSLGLGQDDRVWAESVKTKVSREFIDLKQQNSCFLRSQMLT